MCCDRGQSLRCRVGQCNSDPSNEMQFVQYPPQLVKSPTSQWEQLYNDVMLLFQRDSPYSACIGIPWNLGCGNHKKVPRPPPIAMPIYHDCIAVGMLCSEDVKPYVFCPSNFTINKMTANVREHNYSKVPMHYRLIDEIADLQAVQVPLFFYLQPALLQWFREEMHRGVLHQEPGVRVGLQRRILGLSYAVYLLLWPMMKFGIEINSEILQRGWDASD